MQRLELTSMMIDMQLALYFGQSVDMTKTVNRAAKAMLETGVYQGCEDTLESLSKSKRAGASFMAGLEAMRRDGYAI